MKASMLGGFTVILVTLGVAQPAVAQVKDLGLGAALALRWSTGPNVVTDAIVDANGIVRVNTRANTSPGIMLEGHYLRKSDVSRVLWKMKMA